MDAIATHLHYWLSAVLLLIGLYGMLASRHLIRKLMGMNILQVAVIMFFISVAAKSNATAPIILEREPQPAAVDYINPLPHALMLTAIVVSVSTTGVALALAVQIYRRFGTLDEAELLNNPRG